MASGISIKYEQFSNKSIWPIDGTLTGTTTLSQSAPGSNDNEMVLYTHQISITRGSPSNAV